MQAKLIGTDKYLQTFTLYGTPKQIVFAQVIIRKLREEYSPYELPTHHSASFWIDHRNDDLQHIITAAKEINGPFTERRTPRYGYDAAIDTIAQLKYNIADILICDIESTGISKGHELTEIAFVGMESGKPKSVYESLVRPTDLTKFDSSKASQVSGLTAEQLENAPTLTDIWPDIQPYLQKHLCTWNYKFDSEFIVRSALKYSLPLQPLNGTCVMQIFSAFMESVDYFKLQEAAEIMGIRHQKRKLHGALYDSTICANVLLELMKQV